MNANLQAPPQRITTDVVIAGTGAAGLFLALQLPQNIHITMLSKKNAEDSDSFLAQGGICVLRDEADYTGYYEDTMQAGHFENSPQAVELMIRHSREIISALCDYGVDFEQDENDFLYTREGGHSNKRILFHKDITGKAITSVLLAQAQSRKNITILPNTTMIDVLRQGLSCHGIVALKSDKSLLYIASKHTVFACGGLGGLYKHSTNFRHLTGDALGIALSHGISLEHIDYIQIHPTTLYSQREGRCFLISESVRGEGAVLLNSKMERFVDELLPRDVVTKKIYEQMDADQKPFVWLSMKPIPEDVIRSHFPNILKQCQKEGYDVTKEPIPVVPAQHYFMGGIKVDLDSKTNLKHLYAVGETSCNGVHGANRLASNSLLESLVFARQAARHIEAHDNTGADRQIVFPDASLYSNPDKLLGNYHKQVQDAIKKEYASHPEHTLVKLPQEADC